MIVVKLRVELPSGAGAPRGGQRAVEGVREEHVVELSLFIEGETLSVHLCPDLTVTQNGTRSYDRD